MAGDSFRKTLRAIQKWFRRKADPHDPYARVRVPLKKKPGGGRSAAVALAEPD